MDDGFTLVEAIKIATLNGATYLGHADHIAPIAVGKNSDLFVVKGDLSSQINNIENVELVFAMVLASIPQSYWNLKEHVTGFTESDRRAPTLPLLAGLILER